MDLGAYMRIIELGDIAKQNGIDVARLRGYRLMAQEEPVVGEAYDRILRFVLSSEYERMIEAVPRFSLHPAYYTFSSYTRKLCSKYLIYDGESRDCVVGVRWEKLHGKRRKAMKYIRKQALKKVRQQYDMFNQYCGRPDVLYIHARVGSANWSSTTWKNYMKEPWFLGAVDDAFDNTYCDIYAKIKEEEL